MTRLKRHVEPVGQGATVPSWWEPLYEASCNRSIFLSKAWIQNWLDLYCKDFGSLWIRWVDGDTVVGGCLLAARTITVRCIRFRSIYLNATGEAPARTPLAEFNDVLHLPGFEDEIAEDLANLVNGMPWDRLMLSGHEDGGVLSRLIPRLPACRVKQEARPAPFIDLAELGETPFESTLSANTRYQIRRTCKRYEQRWGELHISRADDPAQALRYLHALATLHNARWKGRGVNGTFESSAVVQFHRRLIANLLPKGNLDLLLIEAGSQPIGYLYNLIDRGKVYFFQSGFVADDDPKMKPGLLTHSQVIEYYRSRGLLEYDFLAGDAQYKRSLASHRRTLCWTIVYRDRLFIRFLLWIRKSI